MKRKLINRKSYVAMAILVVCSVFVGCEKESNDQATPNDEVTIETPGGSSSHQKSTGGSCPSSWTCPTGYNNNGTTRVLNCGCYLEGPQWTWYPRTSQSIYSNGLGVYKQAYYNAGASDNFLAGAMMETNLMDPLTYVYGDKYPNGTPKTGDAANFGACKQGWFMMRQSYSRYLGQSASQWNNGAELNYNKSYDIASYNAGRNKWGEWAFLAGHRNGQTGLNEALANRYSYDIKNFIYGYQWVRSQIQRSANYRTNDVRFWVDIPAI